MLKIDFDCHLHTTRSACGENMTDEWLCRKAHENAVRFTVTDHAMHLYYEPAIAWAMMTDDGIALYEERKASGRDTIARYIEDIRSCGHPNMMAGIELDVQPDGQIMFPADLRDQLDIMVGALHYMPTIQKKAPEDQVIAEFKRQTTWLLEYGVDVLAHPFRIMLQQDHAVSPELVEWTVEQAGKYHTAVEINSHKPFVDHDVAMVKLAVARGLKLATGTDAHNSRDFGVFDYHRDILKQAGVSDEQAAPLLFRL